MPQENLQDNKKYKFKQYQQRVVGIVTNSVQIDDITIQILREWEPYPFTGTTENDLADYIGSLRFCDHLFNEDKNYKVPVIIKKIYNELFKTPEFSVMWSSIDNVNSHFNSTLIMSDNGDNTIKETPSVMHHGSL